MDTDLVFKRPSVEWRTQTQNWMLRGRVPLGGGTGETQGNAEGPWAAARVRQGVCGWHRKVCGAPGELGMTSEMGGGEADRG